MQSLTEQTTESTLDVKIQNSSSKAELIENTNQRLAQINSTFNSLKLDNIDRMGAAQRQVAQQELRYKQIQLYKILISAWQGDPAQQAEYFKAIGQVKAEITKATISTTSTELASQLLPDVTLQQLGQLIQYSSPSSYEAWQQLDLAIQRRLLLVNLLCGPRKALEAIYGSAQPNAIDAELEYWRWLPYRKSKFWLQLPDNIRQEILSQADNNALLQLAAVPPAVIVMDHYTFNNLLQGLIRWNMINPALRKYLLQPQTEKVQSMQALLQASVKQPLDVDSWSQIYRSTNPMLVTPVRCQSCFFPFNDIQDFERSLEEEVRRDGILSSLQKRMFTLRFSERKGKFSSKESQADLERQMQTAVNFAEANPWLRACVRYGITRMCCLNTLMTGFTLLPPTATMEQNRMLRVASRTTNVASLQPAIDSLEQQQQLRLKMRVSGAAATTEQSAIPGSSGYIGLGTPKDPKIMSHEMMRQTGVRRPPQAPHYTTVPQVLWVNDAGEKEFSSVEQSHAVITRRTYLTGQTSLPTRTTDLLDTERTVFHLFFNDQEWPQTKTAYHTADKSAMSLQYVQDFFNDALAQQEGGPQNWPLKQENIVLASETELENARWKGYRLAKERHYHLKFYPRS